MILEINCCSNFLLYEFLCFPNILVWFCILLMRLWRSISWTYSGNEEISFLFRISFHFSSASNLFTSWWKSSWAWISIKFRMRLMHYWHYKWYSISVLYCWTLICKSILIRKCSNCVSIESNWRITCFVWKAFVSFISRYRPEIMSLLTQPWTFPFLLVWSLAPLT